MVSGPGQEDAERRTLELRKLAAEVDKLQAEIANIRNTAKANAEASRLTIESRKIETEEKKLNKEIQKLQTEKQKLSKETDKLDWEYNHLRGGRLLEWVKGFFSSAALVAAVVALFSLFHTISNELQKRLDGEFTSALNGISESNASKRTASVVNLAGFLESRHKNYHERTLNMLVRQLRLEPDPGVRGLIRDTLIYHGEPAKAKLETLRKEVLTEIRPLFDEESREKQRILVLQHAFLESSRTIASISKKPIELSNGPFKGFRFLNAELSKANFKGAILWHADFYRATLTEASFEGANLRWASLYWAKLPGADLKEADLECADLAKVDFRTVRNIPHDKMAGTNWRDAIFEDKDKGLLEKLYPEGTAKYREIYCKAIE
jgi:Pentapeptide repeats (8 copies)